MKAFKFFFISLLIVSTIFLFACDNGKSEPSLTVPTPVSLSLEGMTTEFAWGEMFSANELTVTAKYSDGSAKELSVDDYTIDITNYNKNAEGTYKISVNLNDTTVSSSYYVNVAHSLPVSITATSSKTSYKIGEKFTSAGIIVNVEYEDGSSEPVGAIEYMVDSSAFDSDAAGTYRINVSLRGTELEAVFLVTVSE